MKIAHVVTTYNRPAALERSLPQVMALGWPVVVVDDASQNQNEVRRIVAACNALWLPLPVNRGLAGALNVGVSFWLADPSVDWIGYVQDDVDVDPRTAKAMKAVGDPGSRPLVTGHDAGEHEPTGRLDIARVHCVTKRSCRATHIHAHRDYWRNNMPIPTNELGTPKRVPGATRGTGSNVDWWLTVNAPHSVGKRNLSVVCVPGLVRSWLWRAEDSLWSNEQRAGEDRPLHSEAIKDAAI